VRSRRGALSAFSAEVVLPTIVMLAGQRLRESHGERRNRGTEKKSPYMLRDKRRNFATLVLPSCRRAVRSFFA